MESFNCPNCGAAASPDQPSCLYCGSAIAARLCPACFGAVSFGMNHCPHCGAATVDPAAERSKPLRCPRCDTDLASISVGSSLLDTCSGCGGLWMDSHSFQNICTREQEQESVLGYSPPPPTDYPHRKSRRAYIPCPECGKLMNHKNFCGCSGVVLDWCRDHGSWFDRSELRQIVAFIRNGGLRKAREREHQKLKDREDGLRRKELAVAALERRFDSAPVLDSGRSGDPLLQFLLKLF